MDEFYNQCCLSTAYQGDASGAPPYTSYESYHLGSSHHAYNQSAQTYQTMVVTTLQSKIAKMEVDLAQRAKDIAEAQVIIQYLLKLNASASSSHEPIGCCISDGLAANKNAASIITGEIKDLLSNIIDILHSKLSTFGINNGRLSSDSTGTQVCGGDLLDMSDKPLSFKTLPIKATNSLESLESLVEDPLHDLEPMVSTLDSAAPGPAQYLAAFQGTQATGPDDFPSQPYVNRFTHAGNQKPQVATCKRTGSVVSCLF